MPIKYPYEYIGSAKHQGNYNSAIDLLYDLCLNFSVMDGSVYHPCKPGQTFEGLPEHMKETLRTLKSDDLAKMRYDLVVPIFADNGWAYQRRQRAIERNKKYEQTQNYS
jgi:hypothetical protein